MTKVVSFEFLPPMLKQSDSYKPVSTNDPFEISVILQHAAHQQTGLGISKQIPTIVTFVTPTVDILAAEGE